MKVKTILGFTAAVLTVNALVNVWSFHVGGNSWQSAMNACSAAMAGITGAIWCKDERL